MWEEGQIAPRKCMYSIRLTREPVSIQNSTGATEQYPNDINRMIDKWDTHHVQYEGYECLFVQKIIGQIKICVFLIPQFKIE